MRAEYRMLTRCLAFLSEVQDWNVLLYGVDGKPIPKTDAVERSLLTDQHFGLDGVCMLHAHMRLRSNKQFWTGYLVDMLDQIEHGITLLIKASSHQKPTNGIRGLSRKINVLAGEFGKAGLGESDIELFTHAAHLMRELRNTYVHYMAGKPPKQRIRKLESHMEEFYSVTERHARGDLRLGARESDAGDVGPFGPFTPFFVRLALLTDRWLRDCLGRCASLPAEHPDDPDKRPVT